MRKKDKNKDSSSSSDPSDDQNSEAIESDQKNATLPNNSSNQISNTQTSPTRTAILKMDEENEANTSQKMFVKPQKPISKNHPTNRRFVIQIPKDFHPPSDPNHAPTEQTQAEICALQNQPSLYQQQNLNSSPHLPLPNLSQYPQVTETKSSFSNNNLYPFCLPFASSTNPSLPIPLISTNQPLEGQMNSNLTQTESFQKEANLENTFSKFQSNNPFYQMASYPIYVQPMVITSGNPPPSFFSSEIPQLIPSQNGFNFAPISEKKDSNLPSNKMNNQTIPKIHTTVVASIEPQSIEQRLAFLMSPPNSYDPKELIKILKAQSSQKITSHDPCDEIQKEF